MMMMCSLGSLSKARTIKIFPRFLYPLLSELCLGAVGGGAGSSCIFWHENHKPILVFLSSFGNFEPELKEGNRPCTNVSTLSSSSSASFPDPRRAFSPPSGVVKCYFVLSSILPCALVNFLNLHVLVFHLGSLGYTNSFWSKA